MGGPAHPGPAHPGPAHPGPAHPGPAYTGPAYTGPAYTGPAYTGPAYTGPAGYPGGQQAAPKDGTNGFAIASFILGLLGVVILSVVFGIAALVRIRKRPQRGKGLAITGLVLSGVWILVVGAVIVAALAQQSPGQPHRSASTGQITAKGTTSIWSLHAGDCFQNPSADQALLGVTSVTVGPCTTPHNAQIFAQFSATGASFPGNSALDRQATAGCQAQIAGHLDKSKLTGAMSLHFLLPQQQSWADGHRTISCFVVAPTSSLTSSLLASPATG
jgi:Domain of unknown function (DUF4190)/Septum formation